VTPHRSLWLQEALGDEPSSPPLAGSITAEVCIVGGGFVGLWTAYWIKQLRPDCDVVLLERDICGGGASGRNGGFVLSWWAKFPSLRKLVTDDVALAICRESEAAIDEIAAFCERHREDVQIVRAGWLWTTRTQAGMGAWDDTVARCAAVNPTAFVAVSPAEIARRTGSPTHLAGTFDRSGATIQPALLARGLRRACLAAGVRIHEGTLVRKFTRAAPTTVTTTDGSVQAAKLVIATNAWSASIPELRRHIVAISSDVVATERMPDELERIGWSGGEAITDSQQMVDYYRTTNDGRIVFGKGGWGIAMGGRIPASFDRNQPRSREVEADLRDAYPQLAHVPVVADWSGPIDRSTDGLPLLGELGGHANLLYGVGWSGNGVGPSVAGGKSLARRALGLDDDTALSALWNRESATFPPDPIRYAGAHLVREAVRRKERAERVGRPPNRLAVKLSELVPAGLEDH
jgi:glycine/D-amino acid oxidase-like deaminating enzyme